MSDLLEENDTLSAFVVINASADAVYAVVSDITRIREWSPETVRSVWTGEDRFASWNRRAIALWKTPARVVTRIPGREFSFVVEVPGGKDWTQWTYRTEDGPDPGTCVLTEEFRMCMRLPWAARMYELLFLFVRDRRSDLQANLNTCVERIRTIVEADAGLTQV
jgi:hypothetical protein